MVAECCYNNNNIFALNEVEKKFQNESKFVNLLGINIMQNI